MRISEYIPAWLAVTSWNLAQRALKSLLLLVMSGN
jgi:hypothetical protein